MLHHHYPVGVLAVGADEYLVGILAVLVFAILVVDESECQELSGAVYLPSDESTKLTNKMAIMKTEMTDPGIKSSLISFQMMLVI